LTMPDGHHNVNPCMVVEAHAYGELTPSLADTHREDRAAYTRRRTSSSIGSSSERVSRTG
jgi:hypothetical protein